MRVEKIRAPQPPLQEVILHLTPKEYHDLLVVASIPRDPMARALVYATTYAKTPTGCQTYDVYVLLQSIRKSEAE